MAFDAYRKEKEVIERGEEVLSQPEGIDIISEYRVMHKSYAKLFKLTRRLVTISDRMEKHLKEANQTIEKQREDLAEAHADLTSRNQLLETKINEFESIFNNSAMGIALLSPDGTFNRANTRLCEMLEENPQELIGRKLEDFLLGSGSSLSGEIGLASPQSGDILKAERQIKTRSGRVFFVQLSGKTLNPARFRDGIIWVIDDISSRKELEKMQADVQRIMQHDLKGPLNSIINLPGIIAQEENLNGEQQEMLGYIEASGRKMLKQIELASDIFKMESGRYVFKPRPVDLASVMRNVALEYQVAAKARGVNLVLQINGRPLTPEDRVVAAADELLSSVMLGNIVKNAIEASLASQEVLVNLEDGDCISLGVHNSKPVPEEVLPVFFNKYATFGKKGGTGLGTYSAKLMAKTQACGIEVRSNVEEGTLVCFRIPRY